MIITINAVALATKLANEDAIMVSVVQEDGSIKEVRNEEQWKDLYEYYFKAITNEALIA